MRAVVFDRPAPDARATRVAELPVPEPGPGQIAIEVAWAGVNFIDVMARRGDPGYTPEWPFVPGLEVAGTVRALGSDVKDPAPGTRVAAFVGRGGLAEVALAPAALVARVPEAVDLARAAAAGGALTTAALLLEHVARVRAGEVVLVHSAGGGVGQALAQLAPLTGAARVVGTVGSPRRIASARAAGYDAVLVRDDSLAQALREETGGRGADVILDPQGTDLLELDLGLAAPGARIVLFGNAAGGALGPLPPAGTLFAGNAMIGGFSLSRMAAQLPERVAGALRDVLKRLAAGVLDLELQSLTAWSPRRAPTTTLRPGAARASASSASPDRRHRGATWQPRSLRQSALPTPSGSADERLTLACASAHRVVRRDRWSSDARVSAWRPRLPFASPMR